MGLEFLISPILLVWRGVVFCKMLCVNLRRWSCDSAVLLWNHILAHPKESTALREVGKNPTLEVPELLLGAWWTWDPSPTKTPAPPQSLNTTPLLPLQPGPFFWDRLLAGLLPWRKHNLTHPRGSIALRSVNTTAWRNAGQLTWQTERLPGVLLYTVKQNPQSVATPSSLRKTLHRTTTWLLHWKSNSLKAFQEIYCIQGNRSAASLPHLKSSLPLEGPTGGLLKPGPQVY